MPALLHGLGARIRELRRARGLSLRVLAERSGISERFLRELECGRGNISVLRLGDVCRALGRSAGAVLGEAEERANGGGGLVVSLLGLRGAGKSTIGPRLAARLKVPFFELDQLVEGLGGLSLGEIFALHGESYYRRLEVEVLKGFLERHPAAVLATGGGIVTNDEAMRLLHERTVTVWLRADPDDHWNRVVRQGDTRPMADNPRAQGDLRRILSQREPLYARARHEVDTSRLGVRRSVETLARTLRVMASPLQ